MNIDYAKIIENANTRKEVLQDLESLLKLMPEVETLLVNALTTITNTCITYDRLDAEGRALLPIPLNERLANLHRLKNHVSEALYTQANFGRGLEFYGITYLSEFVQDNDREN